MWCGVPLFVCCALYVVCCVAVSRVALSVLLSVLLLFFVPQESADNVYDTPIPPPFEFRGDTFSDLQGKVSSASAEI